MKTYLIILCLLFPCLLWGKTNKRVPAQDFLQTAHQYVFEKSYECERSSEVKKQVSQKNFIEWSSLSGMLVGPGFKSKYQIPDQRILRPFLSDGCSSSPEGLPTPENKLDWIDCCIVHDVAYWLGGTEEDKEKADLGLKQCMTDKGFPHSANLYYLSVKKFGGPETKKAYRWGYGWNYNRPYQALTPEEIEQAESLYKVSIDDLLLVLFPDSMKIIGPCETEDIALDGYTATDRALYHFFNHNLKKDTRLEWVLFKRSYPGKRYFAAKIDGCPTVVNLTIRKKDQKVIELNSECPDYLDSIVIPKKQKN